MRYIHALCWRDFETVYWIEQLKMVMDDSMAYILSPKSESRCGY